MTRGTTYSRSGVRRSPRLVAHCQWVVTLDGRRLLQLWPIFIHFTLLPALSNFDGGSFLGCQTDNPDHICSSCIAFFLPSCTTSSALVIYQRCLDSSNSSSSQAKDACTFRLLTARILEQHLEFLSISSAHKQRNTHLPHISPILL